MASTSTPDLFGEPALPEGFRYRPDVLSPADERRLVHGFEALDFQPYEFRGYAANRLIHTFGERYLFAGQRPRADAGIPDALRPLMDIAAGISGKPAESFAQIMVTRYPPGAGIGWHRDRPEYEDIVGFSFLAPCDLRLRRRLDDGKWDRRSAHLEPRSVYLLSGAVRDAWQHSIVEMDMLRYSVTLRTFRPGKGAAAATSLRR